MTVDYESLARDLIARTEQAVATVAYLAVDTDITFKINDIVDAVERELPTGYPEATTGELARRDVIMQMARDILNGEM
jgi:glycerol kinase